MVRLVNDPWPENPFKIAVFNLVFPDHSAKNYVRLGDYTFELSNNELDELKTLLIS